MIKFVSEEGLLCPCLFCDFCGERIGNPGLAIIGFHDIDRPDMLVLHKGRCDRAYEALRGKVTFTCEIAETLEHLRNNTLVYTDHWRKPGEKVCHEL